MGTLGDMPLVVLASSTPSAFYTDPASPELSGRMAELALLMLDGSRLAVAQPSSTGRVEPSPVVGTTSSSIDRTRSSWPFRTCWNASGCWSRSQAEMHLELGIGDLSVR